MNYSYRNKTNKEDTFDIEAFQMTKEQRWNKADWPEWFQNAWYTKKGTQWASPLSTSTSTINPTGDCIVICSEKMIRIVSFDDWIIKYANGDLFAFEPDLFNRVYEKKNLMEECCETCKDKGHTTSEHEDYKEYFDKSKEHLVSIIISLEGEVADLEAGILG